MAKYTDEEALNYHEQGRPGKIEVIPTKPYSTQRDLTLAYSPGVAVPCLAIEKNPEDVYKYTAKGNLVAVISNGTAVLGLGDIGAEAGKPVMEGKGLLFKIFADVDVFDIEINETDPDKLVEIIKAISPTFGGINLEDIKAPECFLVEERLKAELNIPVMHDDQHGTAIISSAGVLSALELVGKKIEDVRMVVNGAGASAVACTKLLCSLGVKHENVIMCDSKGVLHAGRTDLNKYKSEFLTTSPARTLAEACVGADIFLGLSVGGALKPDMLMSMAPEAIVFAMANPTPEINYDEAKALRKDIIIATGRSDYPNQVNNVLGFPFIFRGALDVRATGINEAMKHAAVKALVALAKEPVPEVVSQAYNVANLSYGRDYIIPKPLDPRLITTVAPAVAKAAMDSGIARQPITDWDAYKASLSKRLGLDNQLVRVLTEKAKRSPKRVVFGEGTNVKILKAAQIAYADGICFPIILGSKEKVQEIALENGVDLTGFSIVDPISIEEEGRRNSYAESLWAKRKRKGLTLDNAGESMLSRNYFGISMVNAGDADAFVSGATSNFSDVIKPALQIVGVKPELKRIAGMYILMTKKGTYFLSDTTINVKPNAQTLVDTVLLTYEEVKKFNIEPVIAMVSYSNFGSYASEGTSPERVRDAVEILHRDYPHIIVDGEIQANYALNKELRDDRYPFTKLNGKDVNTLIFPNLSSGNITYKIMQEIGGADVIGPVVMGINKPVHVIPTDASVREIVYLTTLAVVDAQ